MRYNRVNVSYKFKRKRNPKLITPCCNDVNTNGKFVNYVGLPDHYGYCHSCGKVITPPSVYKDDYGNEFNWNDTFKKFMPVDKTEYYNSVIQGDSNRVTYSKAQLQYIDIDTVVSTVNGNIENNLLKYLQSRYTTQQVNYVKKLYYIGTSKEGWTVFWSINKDGKAQKAKACLYTIDGKRTKYFKVPYKNADGYYSCLFGEHLLKNNTKPILS